MSLLTLVGFGGVVTLSGLRPGRPLGGTFKMSGKFVLEKGITGKFHFNLHTANGQVIATSQHYESKEGALHGIELVKHNAPDAVIEDLTEE
jgi:uncharacterized protein